MEQDGTYALEVGQMSELIETDSGVHIILRTA
jgi:parvulin-like peptidyl-prolyl isomerase